jgi:hypothetical protein
MKKYELKKMSGELAKQILKDVLHDLEGIDEDEMTTFELRLLRKCVIKPPHAIRGAEWKITGG